MKRCRRNNIGIHALVSLCLVFVLGGCAGSGVFKKPCPSEKMIHYSELKSLDESRNLNNLVMYVNKGETIPLKLSMETDFMEFKQDQVEIIAKEKLYFMVKMPENLSVDELEELNRLSARSFSEMSKEERAAFLKDYMIYISRDAVSWAPLYGSRAYREVLGFKSGLLSFAVLASTNNGLGASFDIKTVK